VPCIPSEPKAVAVGEKEVLKVSSAEGDDVIDLLLDDHTRIRKLCLEYRSIPRVLSTRRRDAAAELIMALTVHDHVECNVLYPALQALNKELADRSFEEHRDIRFSLYNLDLTNVEEPSFDAMVNYIANVSRVADLMKFIWSQVVVFVSVKGVSLACIR
jgi:hypothetical protein